MNERLIWEAYACLKDLGIEWDYNEFLKWLNLKLGEQNVRTEK